MRNHGYLKTSMLSERNVQAMDFTKVDVICSTIGWLKDASQTLKYGKNYEGY
jgi:hypothetical protein